MVRMYCRWHLGTRAADAEPCAECGALLEYALQRLERCPYLERKPTCVCCPAHCYKPEMRERMRVVMRYAGPRMLKRHPVLAVAHLLAGRRGFPPER